jgi:hypothetical protein
MPGDQRGFMGANYENIIRNNLSGFPEWMKDPATEARLGAAGCGDAFCMKAFGQDCRIEKEGISLSGKRITDPRGIVISLYARHASPEDPKLQPFIAFKDFPGSMPYHGAFSANSERVLIPHVALIRSRRDRIKEAFDGWDGSAQYGGDLSMILRPLPKVALFYVFYLADEEFPPSVSCLFSANALAYLPLDGAADLAEYTTKRIIELVTEG